MKLMLTIGLMFFSLTTFAGDDCVDCGNKGEGLIPVSNDGGFKNLSSAISNESLIKDDLEICYPARQGSYEEVIEALKKKYNTTLKESYTKIRCGGYDLLGMVVENPANRFMMAYRLEKYFVHEIKKPELFSKVLINEIEAKDILIRINNMLNTIKDNPDLKLLFEEKLLKLQKRYKTHLSKYPV